MLMVSVICSDADCARELDLWADSLDEVVRSACDCGCTFEVLSVSEAQEARLRLRLVPGLGRPRTPPSRRAA
jgi:hypothetical protein